MTKLGQAEMDAMVSVARRSGGRENAKGRNIQPCNFRSAGRLSNESARALTTLHETFARNATNALDLYLGTAIELRLVSLEQLGVRDYLATMSPSDYCLPFSIAPVQGTVVLELDSGLLFSVIDLLLGGTGEMTEKARELTDIDEELLRSITSIITQELETAWSSCGVSLTQGDSIDPAAMRQIFPSNERVLLLLFEVSVSGVTGSLKIVTPASFGSALLRKRQLDPLRRRGEDQNAGFSLRDKLYGCSFQVSTDLANLKVPVRSLIDLKPGSLLNLQVPVVRPIALTIEGYPIFETVPVRNGKQKAAQLGKRSPSPEELD